MLQDYEDEVLVKDLHAPGTIEPEVERPAEKEPIRIKY